MTLAGSSLSSSSAMATSTTLSSLATPSSPCLIPGDDNTGCFCATGMEMDPYRGWRKAFLGNPTESWPGLKVPSAYRPVVRGKDIAGVA
jgi:hypothetical protein